MTARSILLALVLALGFGATAAADEPQTTESGLKYTIIEPGEGEPPSVGDRVTLEYVATLADGTQFGSTYDRGRPFSALYDSKWLIAGVYEGLAFLKPGGKIRLDIPWKLGFGETGKRSSKPGNPPVVPPETDVVYEIVLSSVERKPAFHQPADEDWTDVDKGLRFAVLEPGEGDAPKPDDRVRLKYALWNIRKELVQSTFGEGKMLDGKASEIRLGERRRRPGERDAMPRGEKFLPEIVLRMKPGEVVWVEAAASWTWGASPELDTVPPNSTTWWELELVDVTSIPEFEAPNPENQVTTASGLKYEVLREGRGRQAERGKKNDVHYVGWKTNGEQFDTSFDTGGTFVTKLEQVIKGWQEGIPLMKEGAIYRFEIPPELAYGARGPPSIGANATLIFWVEVEKVW